MNHVVDEKTVNDDRPEEECKPSPWRFYVIIIFSIFGFTNQAQLVQFANTVRQTQEFYDCSAFAVNMLTTVYAAVYVFCAFPSVELVERQGLRTAIRVGTFVNFLGTALKVVTSLWFPNYWLLLFSQFCGAGGQLLNVGLPPLLSSTWFPPDERQLSTSIGLFMGFLGMSAAFGLAPLAVNPTHKSKEDFTTMYWPQALLAGIAFLGTVVLLPEQPAHPPSVTSPLAAKRKAAAGKVTTADTSEEARLLVETAAQESEMARLTTWQQMKLASKNKNFLGLLAMMGMLGGITTALAAVLAQLFQPYLITESQAGVITSLGILAGCIGCGGSAVVLSKYRKYKSPLVAGTAVFVLIQIAVLICTVTIPIEGSNFLVPTAVGIITASAVCLPLLPIGMEFAVEITYPAPEALAGTACMWALNSFSIIFIVGISILIGNVPTATDGQIILSTEACLLAIACTLVYMRVKEDLRRLKFEQEVENTILNRG